MTNPRHTGRVPIEAITGTLLHRAWLKSGRPDPLIADDAWDGFALTVQAIAQLERLDVIPRFPTSCTCGSYHPDLSGEAGCGNCGADYAPGDAAYEDALEAALGRSVNRLDLLKDKEEGTAP